MKGGLGNPLEAHSLFLTLPWLHPSYATDLVVCVALGCDMFDCVYPTRTAVRPGPGRGLEGLGAHAIHDLDLPCPQRFGSALVPTGNLQLKKQQYAKDFSPINSECPCPTCQK